MRLFSPAPKAVTRTVAYMPPWGGEPGSRFAFVSAEYGRLHRVDVNFHHTFQLVGARFRDNEGRLTLALRWRCLRRPLSWLRCFGHVHNAQGEQVGSLDHEVLDCDPPVTEWRPGDEGYEERYLYVNPEPGAPSRVELGPRGYEVRNGGGGRSGMQLRLGLYDTVTGARLPVVGSTLLVAEEATAAVLVANAAPGRGYLFQMEPAALQPCRVVFAHGPELAGWSVTRQGRLVWVRLHWRAVDPAAKGLRFFGHAVETRDPQTPTLAGFDQEMMLERRTGVPEFEQNILRALPEGEANAAWLRAGLCTSKQLERLAIRYSDLDFDAGSRSLFLPLPGA